MAIDSQKALTSVTANAEEEKGGVLSKIQALLATRVQIDTEYVDMLATSVVRGPKKWHVGITDMEGNTIPKMTTVTRTHTKMVKDSTGAWSPQENGDTQVIIDAMLENIDPVVAQYVQENFQGGLGMYKIDLVPARKIRVEVKLRIDPSAPEKWGYDLLIVQPEDTEFAAMPAVTL